MAQTTRRTIPADVEDNIQRSAGLLLEAANPEKIILFGSYTRGDFDLDSDLDFLVIPFGVENMFEDMACPRSETN